MLCTRTQFQLASWNNLHYIWLLLLIVIPRVKLQESNATVRGDHLFRERGEKEKWTWLTKKECEDKVYKDWKNISLTTPDAWVDEAIEALNTVRLEREPSFGNLTRNDELCQLAQLCANSEITITSTGLRCRCTVRNLVDDWLTFQEGVITEDLDSWYSIEKLKSKVKDSRLADTGLFKKDTKYICIAFAKELIGGRGTGFFLYGTIVYSNELPGSRSGSLSYTLSSKNLEIFGILILTGLTNWLK